MDDPINSWIARVDIERMRRDLFYLAKDPLPCRQLNITLPGHDRNTLYEADDYIAAQLTGAGYTVEREAVAVQAFRRDETKPLAHQYSRPDPADPWYEGYNLYARIEGRVHPEQLIVAIAHKDSQSWFPYSPGAKQRIGTVAELKIARLLARYEAQRSLWFIWCNEEHWPWTSVTAAQNVVASGREVVAVLNLDGVGVRSLDDRQAGRLTNVTRYSSSEGEALADQMAELNARYGLGLVQRKHFSASPNDDDGSFIKAGIPHVVLNIGSMPYADPNYHTTEDVAERVDLENARLGTQLSLAALLEWDRQGRP